VRAEIERALAPRLAEMETSAEWVLVAIAYVAFGDIRDVFDDQGPLKAPSEWDERTAASVVGLEIGTSAKGKGEVVHAAKIKRADRLRALDMLARHHSLYNDGIFLQSFAIPQRGFSRCRLRSHPATASANRPSWAMSCWNEATLATDGQLPTRRCTKTAGDIGKWVPLFDRVQATSVRAREKAVSDSQLARRLALSGSRSAGQQSELAFVVHTLAVKLDDEGAQTVGFLA